MSHHKADEADGNSPTSPPPDEDTPDTQGGERANPEGSQAGEGGGSGPSSSNASAGAQTWTTQLQGMLDNLATQSAPVVREVGAKAAEIAALAAERTGPLATRAADATAVAAGRLAERSRNFASELRRPAGETEPSSSAGDRSAIAEAHQAEQPDEMGGGDASAPGGPTA